MSRNYGKSTVGRRDKVSVQVQSNSVNSATVASKAHQKMENGSINADSGGVPRSDDATTPPATVDIETYYRERGVSYSHIRRMNRNYVRHDGPPGESSRGIVFWDSFTPPPGYTLDDLPNSDSLILSQPKEEAVSPAILTAARYKNKYKPVVKPAPSSEEFEELYNRLTKRKDVPDKENSPQIAKRTPVVSTQTGSPLEELSIGYNTSAFPDCDDDGLNDSDLVRCSQAVEQKFLEQKNKTTNNDSFRIMDLVDPPSAKKFDIGNQLNSMRPISASTPINCNDGNAPNTSEETPRTTPAIPRRSSRSKANAVSGSGISSNIFDSSTVEPEPSPSYRRSQRIATPRMLFSSNKASTEPPKTEVVGDFASDDDDELFSQIEIPSDDINVDENIGAKYKGEKREVYDQSTLIVTPTEDIADVSTQIDVVEGMALRSSKQKATKLGNLQEDQPTQVCNSSRLHQKLRPPHRPRPRRCR